MTIHPITTKLGTRQFHFGRFCLELRFTEAAMLKVTLVAHTGADTKSVAARIPMSMIVASTYSARSLWSIHPLMEVPIKSRFDPGLAIDLVHDGEVILSTWIEPTPITQHVLSEAKRMFIW